LGYQVDGPISMWWLDRWTEPQAKAPDVALTTRGVVEMERRPADETEIDRAGRKVESGANCRGFSRDAELGRRTARDGRDSPCADGHHDILRAGRDGRKAAGRRKVRAMAGPFAAARASNLSFESAAIRKPKGWRT
jgi:hypothetical protein